MRYKTTLYFLLTIIILLSSCAKSNPLNDKLDRLETIINKYEPEFNSIEYGTKEYSEMIVRYNEEIFKWADDFEKLRYKKDDKGNYVFDESKNVVMTDEFVAVENRFYELNNRMTKMVLRNIPKQEEPLSQPEPVAEQPK